LDINSENLSEPALPLEYAYHVTVENIHLLHNGIIVGNSSHNTIKNNLLEEHGSISIVRATDNVIKGNELRSVRTEPFWVIEGSKNNIITGNQGGCTGMRSVHCINNIYRNNTIKGFRVQIF
jgi:parallel beta-helix repeat protein